jgi:hypothetical protein
MAEETKAEEIARLRREITMRQIRLAYLVFGDQGKRVSLPMANTGYFYNDHMR